MEQTRLQKIVEQKANQIRIAIEEAIADGAKIEQSKSYSSCLECRLIDVLYVQKHAKSNIIAIVLNFSSEKIASVFEPSKEDLAELAEQKRKELAEIEQQLNERAKE